MSGTTDGRNMRKKKTVAGLVALGLLMGLGGCTQGGGTVTPSEPVTEHETGTGTGETGTGTEETETGTKEAGETEAGSSTADYKEKLVVDKPGVEAFEFAYTWEDEDTRVMPYGEDFLIVESRMYDAEIQDPKAAGVIGSKLRILDTETGEFIKQAEFPDLDLNADKTIVFDDGSLGILTRYNTEFVWLDADLKKTGSFDFEECRQKDIVYEYPDVFGFCARTDRKGMYFAGNKTVYYLDLETGDLTNLGIEIEGSEAIYVSDLLFDNRVLSVISQNPYRTFFYEYDVSTPDKATYRSHTSLQRNISTLGDEYVGIYNNMENDEHRVYTGTFSGNEISWYEAGRYLSFGDCEVAGNGVISWEMGEGAPITYVDLKNECIRSTDLGQYLDGEGFVSFTKDSNRGDDEFWMVYSYRELAKARIYMIDMDQCAEVSGKLELQHVTASENNDEEFISLLQIADPNLFAPYVMMEKYGTLEEYARAMSETYGMHIYFDDSAESYYAQVPDFAITPLIPDDSTWGIMARMDKVLSTYPEGFFSQLHSDLYPNGVVLCLAAGMTGLEGQDTVNSAEGLVCGGWDSILVVLDSYSTFLEQNIYHEFCHAIDRHVETVMWQGVEDDYYLVSEQWNTLNPEGFGYELSYSAFNDSDETYGMQYTKYGYDEGVIGLDDVYFIDYYATLYDTEDRARIMEFFCAKSDEKVLDSVHLQAKIKYMSEYIRYYFDDSTWPETVIWEKGINEERNTTDN